MMKRRLVAILAATALAFGAMSSAPLAAADDGTISDMVENTGAREMPFWAYLYDNGFGYLSSDGVYRDGRIVCANRAEGVPDSQIVGLLETRGYSLNEAQAIVIATNYESNVHPFCTN
jgi:hypothetical protein